MTMVSVARQIPESHHGPLIKLGGGEVGGKARGLGFLAAQLELFDVASEFSPHRLVVPETVVVATDAFDQFVEDHGLRGLAGRPDEEVTQRVLAAPLSPEIERALRRYVLQHKDPIAVRSSSLSEDALDHPFAGVYTTYMLPNNARSVQARVTQLSQALRLVWAQVLGRDAIAYMRAHGIDPEQEKMAVVLQQVVGGAHGAVFYPFCSGVARSCDDFPIGVQRAEDGTASIVLGLGKRAVDDQDALRFSPARPTVRPEAARASELLEASQRAFYGVDLEAGERDLTGDDMDTLRLMDVSVADEHGTLEDAASTWVDEDQTLYNGTARGGRRVLTFHRLLRGELFPLPALLRRVLRVVADGFGRDVEIEFALTLEAQGGARRGVFHLLQARPMSRTEREAVDELPDVPPGRLVLRSGRALGHRRISGVRHLLFVDPCGFDRDVALEAAREIAAANEELLAAGEPYVLLLPGRIGTRNPALGVPLTFPQVAGAAALVELSTRAHAVEPSLGTHFFHNVVSRGVPFLFVDARRGDVLNRAWIDARWALLRGPVRHLRLDRPLEIVVFGPRQEGVIHELGD